MTGDARKLRLIAILQGNGIDDPAILGAIAAVPRDRFVPAVLSEQAWEDAPLPIGLGQTISQPTVVALMTGALAVDLRHRVLEIGTGSGYQAAVLSRLCRRVYTIERHRPLLDQARQRFEALGLHNVTTRYGDGIKGWPEQAPFDRILVTAAAAGSEPPPALVEQLAAGGVLVIPLGEDRWDQRVVRFRKTDAGLEREELWPVRFVPLLPDLPAPEPAAEADSDQGPRAGSWP